MSCDPRDEPNVEVDMYGSMFYVTEDGKKIPVKDKKHARSMEELERHLKEYSEMGGMK